LELDILNHASVVYRTTAHHRRTPNGYGGYFPASFFELPDRLAALPDEGSLAFLRRTGVRFVVVGRDAGPWQSLRDPANAAPLRLVGVYADDLLYEVPATA
jgi:hypothetical protein